MEYAKVMGQTGQKWALRDLYRGAHWQVARTTGLLMFIFGTIDMFRRKTDVLNSFSGTIILSI